MGFILIIIVAILAVAGLISFNMKAFSSGEKPSMEKDDVVEESITSSEKMPTTEIIDQTDSSELKMKDDDYRLALSKLHNQLPSSDQSSEEDNPTIRKMNDDEYRGTLENFKKHSE